MSAVDRRHTPEPGGRGSFPLQRRSHETPAESRLPSASPMPTRLEVIHNLVHSGDYHVPAAAIADRMIEQLMIAKLQRDS